MPIPWKPREHGPTEEQIALLNKLMLSSEFTQQEVDDVQEWIYGPKSTEEKMSKLIDKALTRIKERDNRKAASDDRRAQYHANKEVS